MMLMIVCISMLVGCAQMIPQMIELAEEAIVIEAHELEAEKDWNMPSK